MKRWGKSTGDYVTNERIDKFLEEVCEISKKHGLSIAHEDGQGAFFVENYNEFDIVWLQNAHDNTSFGGPFDWTQFYDKDA